MKPAAESAPSAPAPNVPIRARGAQLDPKTLLDALDECHLVGDARGYSFVDSAGATVTLGFRTLVDEPAAAAASSRGSACKKAIASRWSSPTRKSSSSRSSARSRAASCRSRCIRRCRSASSTRISARWSARSTRRRSTRGHERRRAEDPVVGDAARADGPRPRHRRAARERSGVHEPAPEIAPTDPVFLQFTSGSTSNPKGVVVTHASLCANAIGIMRAGLECDPEADARCRGCRSITTWASSASCSHRSRSRCRSVFLPTIAFVKRPTLWMDAIHEHRGDDHVRAELRVRARRPSAPATPISRAGICRACASSAAAPSRSTPARCARSSRSSPTAGCRATRCCRATAWPRRRSR